MTKPWFRAFTKSWYVTVNGKSVPLGKDKKAAFAKWHEMEAGDLEGLDMPFPKAVEFYLQSLAACSKETRDVARRHLTDFQNHVGTVKCSRLRAHHWTAFVRTKEWSQSTRRTCLNKILACLNYCVDQGRLDPHKFKVGKKDLPRFERRTGIVTAEEQKRMELAAPEAFRDFLVGLRLSGARPGELSGALIEHLDLPNGLLLVANKTARKTGETYRPIYLSPDLKALIVRLVDGRASGFIWRNSDGGQWNRWSLTPAMRRLRLKLGLRKGVTLYQMRHRYVTAALERGLDAISVSELVGHKDISMIKKHYAALGKDHLKEAARKAVE